MFDRKSISVTTLNLVPTLLKLLSHLGTSYHFLSPILDRKLIAVTTLNLVPRLFKKLSHLATSCHVLSHLITPYPPCLREN